MTDFGSRHKASHQDGGGDEIDCAGLPGRINYVDRGDPAASDWIVSALTTNESWLDLDCSSIVPANAKAIIFIVSLYDDTIGGYIQLRKNGNTNEVNVGIVTQTVSNELFSGMLIVPCDANRKIEYWASNKTWTAINITICGWIV